MIGVLVNNVWRGLISCDTTRYIVVLFSTFYLLNKSL